MKTIILSLTLMYNAFCMGQNSGKRLDSIFKLMQDSGISTMSVGGTGYFIPPDSIIHWYTEDEQKQYERWWRGKQKSKLYDSVTVYGNEEPVYHRKKDTILVILLITDSIKYNHGYTDIAGKKTIIYGNYEESAKWRYGYSVRELHNVNDDYFQMPSGSFYPPEQHFWQHLYYLDANKQPIYKSIIVWDAKEIGK